MASIQQSLDLLAKLERVGFDDRAFWRLHHFRLKGEKDTIRKHREYLLKQQANGGALRDDDSNEEVQRRLQLVLDWYELGAFASGEDGVFAGLAEAAFHVIPNRRQREV